MSEKKNRRLLPLAAGLMSIAMIGAACGGSDGGEVSDDNEDQKDLEIGYITWDENIALAHLFQNELDERGYDVELTEADAGLLFEGVSNGDLDLFQDVWLPTTHETYWEGSEEEDTEGIKDEVEDLGTWYEDATLHLTVPEYVDEVDSISDLQDNADLFDGEITGIDSGAGIMEQTEDSAIPGYDLEESMDLVSSSPAGMLTELDGAITAEEPIVVTLWRPHWAYSRYDLKDLEDPEGHMGSGEELHTIGRDGFSEDYPNLAEMIENFEMDDEALASLEDVIEESDEDPSDAVAEWADDNEDLVEEYFGDL